MSFLGYILVGGQVKAGPAKAQAVKEWPTPTSQNSTVLAVCQFLQMVYTQLQPCSLTLNMPHPHQCSIHLVT